MPVPIVPLVAAGASLVGSWLSNRSQNKNADKQIAASREENEKARAHNLMLAELQNKWNVEQWAKENEYNSPSAQMARYAAAGLNPNLIYGQSNTSAQLSGSLSSGAPASPADMSAYGRKGSAVGKALENLDPFMYEQLRGMRLDNDKKESDLRRQNLDNAFNEWLKSSDPYTNSDSPFAKSLEGRRAWMDLQNAMSENNLKDIQLSLSTFQHQMNQKTADYLIRKLASEVKISEEQAKNFATQLAYEIGILKADERIKTSESLLSNPDFLQKLEGSGWQWATTFSKFIHEIIHVFK